MFEHGNSKMLRVRLLGFNGPVDGDRDWSELMMADIICPLYIMWPKSLLMMALCMRHAIDLSDGADHSHLVLFVFLTGCLRFHSWRYLVTLFIRSGLD